MSKNKNKQNQPQKPTVPAPKEPQTFQAVPPKEPKLVRNTNPTAIKWPTDPWGFTRELRAAVTTAATRCAGSTEKKELLDKTLEIALEFLDASHERKSAAKTALMEKARAEQVQTPAIPKRDPKPIVQPEPELDPEDVAPALAGDDLEAALFGDELEDDNV